MKLANHCCFGIEGVLLSIGLSDLLDGLEDRTKSKFEKMPAVVSKNDSFDVMKLPIDKAEWHAIEDVVCVYFDLKASTSLAKKRAPASTASIYDAGVGGVVGVMKEFETDFIDIQGDGGFGLFWGENRYERAVAAGITIRAFSRSFTEQLEKKWPDAPSTGFKVGVGSGSLMAKQVGLPRLVNFQEPVWAGNPVNYAAKAAQQASPESMYVTGSVFDSVVTNDYLMFSCDCKEPSFLWESVTLNKIPDDEKFGMSLGRVWCSTHGEEFCNAVLDGSRTRANISSESRGALNRIREGEKETHEARRAREKTRALVREVFLQLQESR